MLAEIVWQAIIRSSSLYIFFFKGRCNNGKSTKPQICHIVLFQSMNNIQEITLDSNIQMKARRQ